MIFICTVFCMLSEKFNSEIDQEKRKKIFYKFNEEILDLLESSDNPEYLWKEFDRLFLKFLRLIKYSNDRNQETKSELDQNTNNLLKRFISFVKNDTNNQKRNAIRSKIKNEQKYFFCDIRELLKTFQNGYYFTKVHNSIWPTSLEEYKDKSLGEQMMHNMYGRERWLDKSCEGGSCSYRTVLLYNFFSKLKEAWLDMDIKIYRYKNLEDNVLWSQTMRHSGLVVNFQWRDYIVDYDWSLHEEDWEMVKSINRYINEYENEWDIKRSLKNFKKWNQKETEQIVFFDSIEEFLKHVNEFPEYKRISLYVKIEDRVFPVKFDYIFTNKSVKVGLNEKWKEYILDDNDLNRENFMKNFMEKIWIIKDLNWLHYITQHEKSDLKMCMDIIKDKVDIDKLHENYTSWEKWKFELAERDWEGKLAIKQL